MIRLIDIYEPTRILPGAIEFLYELMKERAPEANISHQALPSFEQHRQFIHRRPYRCWYLIEVYLANADLPVRVPRWVGYVSATHFNEIGVGLQKQAQGHGIGPAAIRMLMKTHAPRPAEPAVRNGRWLANIAPGNEHSRHVFEKLGFTLLQHTYELTEEEHHGKANGETGPPTGAGGR